MGSNLTVQYGADGIHIETDEDSIELNHGQAQALRSWLSECSRYDSE